MTESETLENKFERTVKRVIRGELGDFLGWKLTLPEEMSPEAQMAYIFLGFDIAGIIDTSGPGLIGYISVGFNEEVSIKLTMSLLGTYTPKIVDIYSAPDVVTDGKDPYAELNLVAASQINEEVEDAVREMANFTAGRMKALLDKEGVKFSIGLPMIIVGKNMTTFATFPMIGKSQHFTVQEGYGCVEFAIQDLNKQQASAS
ncbi:MAG: chemotaxis protein CheX [Candidatus Omnitrophota bacterium]